MRLIFVDDEPFILEGLRRSLRSMRSQWTMEFASSAAEALEMMSHASFDVVVTDMRMPGMDGAQLLREVRNRYPQTVRIVLSGQSSREALLRSISPSHQFLSKPCDVEELKARVAKAFVLYDLLENATIKGLISQLSSVPTLPVIYKEIAKEIESREPSAGRIGALISKDPAMTAKILQLANSALLGVRSRISNASQAVSLIGLDMIRALVISAHIFTQFEARQMEEMSISRLWKHSLATASVGQAIARAEHASREIVDDSFTAGLLHDIGKMILASIMPEKYKAVLQRVAKESLPVSQAEYQAFSCTHAEVGAYLIGIWGLPHAIVEAVALHGCPSKSPTGTFSVLTAVHAADVMVSVGEFSHIPMEQPLDRQHLEALGLADHEAKWRQICEQTLAEMKPSEVAL